MPFKSKAQARFMFANRDRLAKQGVDVAEWAHKTDFKAIPNKVSDEKKGEAVVPPGIGRLMSGTGTLSTGGTVQKPALNAVRIGSENNKTAEIKVWPRSLVAPFKADASKMNEKLTVPKWLAIIQADDVKHDTAVAKRPQNEIPTAKIVKTSSIVNPAIRSTTDTSIAPGDNMSPTMLANPYASTQDAPEYENGWEYAQQIGVKGFLAVQPEQMGQWRGANPAWRQGFADALKAMGRMDLAQMLEVEKVSEAKSLTEEGKQVLKAYKSKKPERFQKELDKGIEIEKEHTDDLQKRERIALDHMVEGDNYYEELDKMENKLKTAAGNMQAVTTDPEVMRQLLWEMNTASGPNAKAYYAAINRNTPPGQKKVAMLTAVKCASADKLPAQAPTISAVKCATAFPIGHYTMVPTVVRTERPAPSPYSILTNAARDTNPVAGGLKGALTGAALGTLLPLLGDPAGTAGEISSAVQDVDTPSHGMENWSNLASPTAATIGGVGGGLLGAATAGGGYNRALLNRAAEYAANLAKPRQSTRFEMRPVQVRPNGMPTMIG